MVLASPSFDELVEAVANHDERLALKLSDQLIAEGQLSQGLYFNRGLAYLNLGDFARARASFEQSLLFAPRDLTTRRKLQQCQSKLDTKLAQIDVVSTPWWNSSEAQVVLLLSVLGILGLALRKLLKREVRTGTLGAAWAAGLLVIGLLAWCNPPPSRGVVVESDAELRQNPESQSGPRLLNGQLVELVGKRDRLWQVRTGQGKTGWVRAAKVVELRTQASDSP